MKQCRAIRLDDQQFGCSSACTFPGRVAPLCPGLSCSMGPVSRPVGGSVGSACLVANLLKRPHSDAEERQRAVQLAAKVCELRAVNASVHATHAAAKQAAMSSKGPKRPDF